MPDRPILLAAALLLLAAVSKNGRRFILGEPLDGQRRTNATFLQHPTKALHPTADRSWWHWRPGWHRSAARIVTVTLVASLAYGLLFDRVLTVFCLALCAGTVIGYAAWKVQAGCRSWIRACAWDKHHRWRSLRAALLLPWQHYVHYMPPLRAALTAEMGVPPLKIRAPLDRSAVTVWTPPEFAGGDKSKEGARRAVAAKLALEDPEMAAKLHGRKPHLVFTRSEPPPADVTWEDIARAIAAAGADELVLGLGKRGAISKASYGQAPHLCIPGGSGGGKSNLAALLLLQEMMRGSLIFNLDPKWISHLWLQDLPNVISAHDVADLHLALCWLGRELKRRTKAAYYSAAGTGRVRGTVGARIIVLCEELNYGMPELKELWQEERGKGQPKQSPAISALSALSCAGRASDMHEWLIAQLLTVQSTGVSDSTIRSNAGIKAMVRWDPPGWGMAVGRHVPMPTPTTIPGRIQLVTGEGVRETQVPYLHLDDKDEAAADIAVAWARQLAVSGKVALIPSGPEGVPPQLWPPSVLGQAERASRAAQDAETPRTRTDPVRRVTIREAVDDGVFGELGMWGARKAVQRAGLQHAGKRGSEHEYLLGDLRALADRKELAK